MTYAGTKSGYGKTVEIDHGFGYKTRYAHAGSIQVNRGQRVVRGDLLGEVGKTGLATAPHLHYEARRATCDGDVRLPGGLPSGGPSLFFLSHTTGHRI